MEEVGKRTRKWRHSRLVILASPTSRRCADPMAKEKAPPPSSKPAKSGGKHTGKRGTFLTPPAHLHRRADPTAKEKAPPPSSKPGGGVEGKHGAFLTPPAHLLHLPVSSLEGRSRAACTHGTEAPKYKQKEKVNKHMVTDTPKYKQITPSVLSERLEAPKEKAPPPSSEPAKSGGGKQKEKVNNAVRFDQATYDKLIVTKAPKYKQMTPSVLSEQKQKEKVNTEAPKYKQITPSVLSEQKQKEKESLLTKDEIANICEKVKLPEGLVSRRREPGSVCLYEEMIEQMIEQEITFPLHPFFLEILNIFKIPPGRLRGYGWFIMISFVKQCEKKNKKPSVQEFFKLYDLKTCDEFCTLYKKTGGEKTRDGRKGSHVSRDWQSRFFFFKPSSNDFPVEWGEDRPRKRDVLEKKETAPDNRIKELETQLASANEKLKDLHLRLKEAERKIVVGEGLRKELHNKIVELKGNIRVFCRVRPLLTESCGAVSYPKSGENIGRGVELMHNAQLYPFAFDKVFDQTASQEEVFTEISQLVQSALDGYKVCIFAYGQTGSGKTHTMMGNPEVHDQKGLIPRAMEKIFQTSQIPISQGLKYKMQASMLEIYNETIRDLLAADNSSAQDGAPSKCKIRHDANGSTDVSGLTVVDVGSMNEVSSLLKQAAKSRSVAKTEMNEESSRSHFVFRLQIVAVNQGTDQQVQGVLNLIDLAGSERLDKSGAAGDRLKETQAINKSLSCLSDVIFSIAKKDEHIPFRNSKLTYLLQPCLGGDSKTLMFVNLSPEASSTNESICSLRFAARVNSCEIGIPRRQTQVRSSALKESAMNAEGKEATEGDLERAMKSCDDLARENDYLRARLKDNPDLTALNNQVQALEGDKNILKTKLNKAEGEVKLLLEENRALRRSKQEAGVLAGQEENIDLKESTPPAIPASQTLQGAQEVKAAVLTSCPELA